ncbi:Os09g0107900 [Oryza sativa Japonica Group]|uniref:Os09g0107900 protein n=3 Tax=Oryza sativa TaxID=4530 RepID=B9G236_ORYSJ|nr:hypothetical protein OsI_30364 [Oryza sativa Indica Group]EEE69182.1 hypothetical protein OsJ_28359 [Oryza sativa Japonica Group]BAT06805.1 Os09g0107900 [Oryza sativa Japonica Group]
MHGLGISIHGVTISLLYFCVGTGECGVAVVAFFKSNPPWNQTPHLLATAQKLVRWFSPM